MNEFKIFLLLSCALAITTQAGITIHGSSSAYTETGGNWLTMGSNDIDESGGLGTDGWFFFGNFNGAQQNEQPFSFHVKNTPSYVSGFAQGANFTDAADEFGGYGAIDDPNLLNGVDKDGGFGLSRTGGAGANNEVITFTVNSLLGGTIVRVGILGGIESGGDGRWDPTSITLSEGVNSEAVGNHSSSPLPANPGGTNTGWVFFDIDSNGTYRVSATKRFSGNGAGVGGLTFDSLIETDITDPTSNDGDAIGDNWEIFYFGDVSRDGTLDFDNDGRTDLQEWQDGTNPVEADGDGDGLNDGEEFTLGTDPFDADSDDDGFDDGQEIAAGSNPNDDSSEPTVAPERDVYASLPQETRDAVVVFSEINYSPAGGDSSLEYIELHNLFSIDIDLSNWRLRGDADFDFPEGTVLGGGEYLVIANDPAALAAATGYSSALGPLSGTLSNGGGRLRLYNNNRSFRTLPGGSGSVGEIRDDQERRRIMDEIEYDDQFPWPVGADGSGATLTKRSMDASSEPVSWMASIQVNGSPGSAQPLPFKKQLAFNELSSSFAVPFQLELHNYGTSAILLGGMVISSSNSEHADYVLPATSLAAGDFHVIDSAALGFTPDASDRLFLFEAGKQLLIDAARVDDVALARQQAGTGRWLHPDVATFGSSNSFNIPSEIVINEIFYSAPAKPAVPGVPGAITEVEVLDFDFTWRYNLDAGTVGLPVNWASSAHAVDGVSWDEGPGLLGFESAALGEPLRTVIPQETKVTYYFEADFVYNGAGAVPELRIDHYIDDGAIFYLNGVEIVDFNMPDGVVTPSTLAGPSVDNAALRSLTVNDPVLLNGANRLSVEVHQSSISSSDVVFGVKVTVLEEDGTGFPEEPYTECDEEWIELYNRGAFAVNLTGWELGGGVEFNFPDGTTIPAGGYLVIARDAAALAAKHPAITILGNYDRGLGNGGDLIVLEDSNGNPADEVRYYDSGKWHEKADGGGSSLELRDPGADNRFADSWAPSDEVDRTAWQTITYEAVATDDGFGNIVYHELQIGLLDAGEVLIDDVSVIENGSIEFVQNGDFDGDSVGSTADKWRALGTHGSHGQTVVVTDPDDPGNRCLHLVATGPTENKHNKLETTFANSQEVVVGNTYRISFRVRWLSGVPLLNSRLYFNYLQRTNILEAPTVWGTPGLVNSRAVVNAGPVLSGLSHSPVIPDAGEATTVSINAADVDGIANMQLFYSVQSGAFQSVAMTADGDGDFSAEIPGQSAGNAVRFYARGIDSLGAAGFYPATGASGGAFYEVQDGRADNSGLRKNLRIIMDENDRQFLFLNTNRMSNDRFPATVIENESTVYYNVALRLKASGHGRYQANDYGLNVRFQPDDLFRGVHTGFALERSNPQRELFAKQLMNRAGGGYWSFYDDVANIILPTTNDTRVGLISMARQGGNFFNGLFPDAEESGTLFNLELHYSPNGTTGGPEDLKIGNPFNHTNGSYGIDDHGSNKETYRWGYQIRSARGRDDYSKMVALNQAMSLEGDELKEELDQLIDADQWMRTFAQCSLNGTDDILGRVFQHNFRFYVRPTDGKIIALQWDLDRTFSLATSGSLTLGLQSAVPTTDRNGAVHPFAKIFEIPQYRRFFDGHLEDQIDTTFNNTYTVPLAAGLATHTGGSPTADTNYVTNRANFLLGSLPASVPFAITTNGGSDFEEADSAVTLEGNAWIDVFSIRVNGVAAEITWRDSETWQIDVPIETGPNGLSIVAFDNRGTEVGGDSITVTNTSGIQLASALNTVISELHYNPADPSQTEIDAGFADSDFFEFVELTNTSANEIDLTNTTFTDGIEFTFLERILLAPGARLVLVANKEAFEFRYGIGVAVIGGAYSGSFRNSGENVRLEAADLTVISEFEYGDDAPWPTAADGDGFSLVLAGDAASNPLDWRSSTALGGNPGSGDVQPYLGGDLLAYALASGPEIELVDGRMIVRFEQNLAADDVVVSLEFSGDLENWADGGELDSSGNLGNGLVLREWSALIAAGMDARHFVRVRVELRP